MALCWAVAVAALLVAAATKSTCPDGECPSDGQAMLQHTARLAGKVSVHSHADGRKGDSFNGPVHVGDPLMVQAHITMFGKYLSKAAHYLEWGVGGSTKFAMKHSNIKSATVIDDNSDWIKAVSTEPDFEQAIRSGRLDIHFVDLGKVNEIGYPAHPYADDGRKLAQVPVKKDPFDLVLVDGRFRLACALQSIHSISTPFVLIIHDYERKGYHVVEKYADKIDQADGDIPKPSGPEHSVMAVFRPKKNIDVDALLRDIEASWPYAE